MFACRLTVVRS